MSRQECETECGQCTGFTYLQSQIIEGLREFEEQF